MSREFEDYWALKGFNNNVKDDFDSFDSANKSWDACKKRVLEILNKHTQPIFDTELRKEDWEKVINLDAIKEIEKL